MNDIANHLNFNINNYMMWASTLLMMMGFYSHLTQKEKVVENKDQKIADTEVK